MQTKHSIVGFDLRWVNSSASLIAADYEVLGLQVTVATV
jgi:hypothetical protein